MREQAFESEYCLFGARSALTCLFLHKIDALLASKQAIIDTAYVDKFCMIKVSCHLRSIVNGTWIAQQWTVHKISSLQVPLHSLDTPMPASPGQSSRKMPCICPSFSSHPIYVSYHSLPRACLTHILLFSTHPWMLFNPFSAAGKE